MTSLTGTCIEYGSSLPWSKYSISALLHCFLSFREGFDVSGLEGLTHHNDQLKSKLTRQVSAVDIFSKVKNARSWSPFTREQSEPLLTEETTEPPVMISAIAAAKMENDNYITKINNCFMPFPNVYKLEESIREIWEHRSQLKVYDIETGNTIYILISKLPLNTFIIHILI